MYVGNIQSAFKRHSVTVCMVLLMAIAGLASVCAQANEIEPITLQTKSGPIVLRPLKHASVLLVFKSKNYYIDPAQLPPGVEYPKADVILITHEHGDHCDPDQVAKLRQDSTIVIANPNSIAKLKFGEAMQNGQKRKVGDIMVEAVPAYNLTRTQFHPKGRDNGYILTVGGKRIYFAGDTEGTPEMKALKNIDVAFLPINLPYTMPPKDAAEAARAFQPKILVPYHQGQSNPQDVADALKDTKIDVQVRQLP
jgi:L-ascorbate metabolism protein UlaG (beta-lactamase superfamily)